MRIKTISQWYLLKQINNTFWKEKIPKEVMQKVYHILGSKKLGKDGFIVLCIRKVHDDFLGLEEAAGMYPYQCYWDEKIDEILVRNRGKTNSWCISYARIKGQKTKIAVIYKTKAYE